MTKRGRFVPTLSHSVPAHTLPQGSRGESRYKSLPNTFVPLSETSCSRAALTDAKECGWVGSLGGKAGRRGLARDGATYRGLSREPHHPTGASSGGPAKAFFHGREWGRSKLNSGLTSAGKMQTPQKPPKSHHCCASSERLHLWIPISLARCRSRIRSSHRRSPARIPGSKTLGVP